LLSISVCQKSHYMDGRIDINFNLLLKVGINVDINFQEYHLLMAFVNSFRRPLSGVLGFYHRTDDGPPTHPRQNVSRSLCTTLHYVVPPPHNI
jgi:hypothetical protein